MKLHVIGIGGAGMKGIAEIAQAKGHLVTGSDLNYSMNIEELSKKGIEIFNEHSAGNVKQANAIAVSGAVNQENPEIIQAKLLNIPIWSRMQTLDRLLHGLGQRISVIGSCGKTSATAMLETVFSSGVKPTVYMGAKSKITGKNGSLGDGRISIIESCEYQGAFFDFRTDNVVLTDIVSNHEDYFGSGIGMVSRAFVNFIESSLASKAFLPVSIVRNEAFKDLLHEDRVITYGIGQGNWQADLINREDFITTFKVEHNKTKIGEFAIKLPGDHLVKHAIPAIALALEFGLSPNIIRESLLDVRLPNRRFDVKYQSDNYIGIDDNARNPSQLASTLSIVSNYLPNYRIIAVAGIWGHLNRRPILEFAKVLKDVDYVMIPELGRAAQSVGGVEDDNAVETLIKELDNVGVYGEKGISKTKVCDKFNELHKNGPVALITFGYDYYSNEFSKIHGEIISKLQEKINNPSKTRDTIIIT